MTVIRIIKIGGSLLLRPDLLKSLKNWRDQFEGPTDTTIAIVGGGQMIDAVRNWDRVRPGDPARVHWRCVEMLQHSFESMRDALEVEPGWNHWHSIATATEWEEWCTLRMRSENVPLANPTEISAGHFVLMNVPAFYHRPAFYHQSASHGSEVRLPEDWRTTTDAIAMWLTQEIVNRFCPADPQSPTGSGAPTGSSEKMASNAQPGNDLPASNQPVQVECVLLKSCEIPPSWTLLGLIDDGVVDPACRVFSQNGLFSQGRSHLVVHRLPVGN